MTELIHPRPLQPGDQVALLSPAGPIPNGKVADDCAEVVRSWGYDVTVGEHAKSQERYLAGTDAQRASDINSVFNNNDQKAIFCTRGGYGCGRILTQIDYKAMRENPTILTGFSDLTALQSGILAQAGVATLHSPTIAMGYVYDGDRATPESHELYMELLTSTEPAGSMKDRLKWNEPWMINSGKAAGQIIGGNLAVFTGILGSPYMPDPKGKILFLEDLDEAPYKLDRFLIQLRLSGYLEQLSGILFGQFTECDFEDPKRGTFQEALLSCIEGLNLPIIGNYPTGHCELNAPLPIGCKVELDATNGDLVFLESFCKE